MNSISPRRTRYLIKLGGASLNSPHTIIELCNLLRSLILRGIEIVLVHGGGPTINEELTKKGLTWKFINGQRQTTPEMMETIEYALVNIVNQSILDSLRNNDIEAQPVYGFENNLLLCKPTDTELIQVGEIISIHNEILNENLSTQPHVIQVIAPIGVDDNGIKYNINADWAATKIASSLRVDKLIFLTDQNGLLDQDKNVISTTSPEQIHDLISSGVISGGMQTKTLTMIYALNSGVDKVQVMNAAKSSQLLQTSELGTTIISDRDFKLKENKIWNQNQI